MFSHRYKSHHDTKSALEKLLSAGKAKNMGTDVDFERIIASIPIHDNRILYVHVPYCDHLCTFCNLNRSLIEGKIGDYADYIIKELKSYRNAVYIQEKSFKAVYFGGGTPTVFNCKDLERILKAVFEYLPIAEDCEITFETTLHNLSIKKIELMQRFGVNRISIGVQTFSDRGRTLLGRITGSDKAIEKITEIRSVFHQTLGIDIIYNYPGQNIEELIEDVDIINTCKLDSVSFYSLMIHKGSTLQKQIETGVINYSQATDRDKFFHNTFLKAMLENEYTLLELSKLIKQGKDEYRYIRLRYLNGDVLPVGIGAGGKLKNLGIYNMAPGRKMYSRISEEYDKYNRIIGLIQFGNYDINAFQEILGNESFPVIKRVFNDFVVKGYMEKYNSDRYQLTAEGVFYGNNIGIVLLDSLIKNSGKVEINS